MCQKSVNTHPPLTSGMVVGASFLVELIGVVTIHPFCY
jgi:hypothetical protein